MKRLLSVILVLSLLLAGCSGYNNTGKSAEMTENQIILELGHINQWIIIFYYNNSLYDIDAYLDDPEGINIDQAVQNEATYYEKAIKYDIFIQGLDSRKYGKYKDAWNSIFDEINRIHTYLTENGADGLEFDSDYFLRLHDRLHYRRKEFL